MLRARRAVALALFVVLAGVACDRGASPTTPTSGSSSAVAESQTSGSAWLSLTGVVRGLELEARSFTLATRTGAWAIRTDNQTEVLRQGARVRLNALRDGTVVAIRAVDCGRYALARTIAITQ